MREVQRLQTDRSPHASGDGTVHSSRRSGGESIPPELSAIVQRTPSADPVQLDPTPDKNPSRTGSSGEQPPEAAGPTTSGLPFLSVVAGPAQLPVSAPVQRLSELPVVDSAPRRLPSPQHANQADPQSAGPDAAARDIATIQAAHSQPAPASIVPVQRSPETHTVGLIGEQLPSPQHENPPPLDIAAHDVPSHATTPSEATHPTHASTSSIQVQRSSGNNAADEADTSSFPADPTEPAAPTAPEMPVVTRQTMTDQPTDPTHTFGLLADRPPIVRDPASPQQVPEIPMVDSVPVHSSSAEYAVQTELDNARFDTAAHVQAPIEAVHSTQAPASPIQVQRSSDSDTTGEADPLRISVSPTGPAAQATPALPVVSRHSLTERPTELTHTVGLLAERPPLIPVPTTVATEPVPAPVQRVTYLPISESLTIPSSTITGSARMPRNLGTPTNPPRTVGPTAAEQPVSLQRVLPVAGLHDADSLRPPPTVQGFPSLEPPSNIPPPAPQQPTPSERPIHTVGPAVSFASMFSATAADDHQAGADGFTSVQLQHAGAEPAVSLQTETSAPAAEPAVDSPPPTLPLGAEATPSNADDANASDQKDDLDEMARRLFDPLSARLRAELWLDRERAGMIADVRR